MDSFALLPDYRGTGIGKALLLDSITKGKALGCKCIALLADIRHTRLIQYYQSMGFERCESIVFLGKDYVKMKMKMKMNTKICIF